MIASSSSLSNVRIVLVEPAGPLNVGSVARVMKNMGLDQLVLVNPQCDPFSDAARQMAVHADDILTSAQQVESLTAALVGCQRAIATTGLDHTTLSLPLEQPRMALPWLLETAAPTALIFGREDRGLTRTELNLAQRLVRIPTTADYLSLNLAQAVAICCYELSAAAPTHLVTPAAGATAPAPLETLELYYQQLEAFLLKIGYLLPHTASSRMEKFRHLFGRTQLSDPEVAMLRGILRQANWAIEQGAEQRSGAKPTELDELQDWPDSAK
ncbi:MAG: RNA methyltransferase [Elainella sp.]